MEPDEIWKMMNIAREDILHGDCFANADSAQDFFMSSIARSLLVLAECAVRADERNTTVITGGDDEIKIKVGDGSDVPF